MEVMEVLGEIVEVLGEIVKSRLNVYRQCKMLLQELS